MRAMRSLIALAGVLLMVLLAGCGGATAPAPAAATASAAAPSAAASAAPAFDLAGLERAAKADGAVTVYTVVAGADINGQIKKVFEAKYPGITVTLASGNASATNTKFEAEMKTGVVLVDVIWVADRAVLDANVKELGSIADLPSWKDFPEKSKTPNFAAPAIQQSILMYNTNRVKPGELTKWTDVLDPKWKGLISATAPSSSASVVANYSLLAKNFGDDFLAKLGQQGVNWSTSGSGPTVALVNSGEKAIGFPVTSSNYALAKAAGAPVAMLSPEPPTGGLIANEQFIGTVAKAKHLNAARLFVNFILSREGQQIVTGNNQGSSALADIPGSLPVPKNYNALFDVGAAERDKINKLLGAP